MKICYLLQSESPTKKEKQIQKKQIVDKGRWPALFKPILLNTDVSFNKELVCQNMIENAVPVKQYSK